MRAKFFAFYREAVGKGEMEMEVESGTTVAQLLERLVQQFPRLKGLASFTAMAVNTEYVPDDYPLKEGDEVAFIPPTSGG